MNIRELIEEGHDIQKGLKYVYPGDYVIRTYDVYELSDDNEYYKWKECAIRFLQLYSPNDIERFIKYSEDFEKHHYIPRYISNMIGVLEACEALPSEKITLLNEAQERNNEIAKVEELEQDYLNYRKVGSAKVNSPAASDAFRKWHASASVLFDKWVYPTDEDWVKFQSIDVGGNGISLSIEYGTIYTPYKKLMAKLKDGRGLKGMYAGKQAERSSRRVVSGGRVNIFISYSHADEKWLGRLKKHLKVLAKYSGNIEYWEDTKLRGGDKWREEITKAIGNANVAVLLVSTDFLASDFISSDELPPILRKAEEDGTRILSLIVSPCEFIDSELGEFQAINDPERTLADLGTDEAAIDRVFLELNKNIKGLI